MTIAQKQCLLAYLGYYPYRDIDGLWGEQSQLATERFQRDYQLTVDGIFGPLTESRIREVIASGEEPPRAQTGTWWDEIKHFTREDCRCKCGGVHCDGYPAEMQEDVCRIVDRAVSHFDRSWDPDIDIISPLRCRVHNANSGGVWNSQHIYGEAFDFRIRGVSGSELLAYVLAQPETRYAYVIQGTDNVHVDIQKQNR